VFGKRGSGQPPALILFWTVSGWIVNDDAGSLLVAAIAGIGFVSLVLTTEDWRQFAISL
jgi:hypothetical protein